MNTSEPSEISHTSEIYLITVLYAPHWNGR